MKKAFKFLAILTAVVVVVLIAAAVAVPMYFNPNDHKDEIVAMVKKETGRDLKLDGDIKLSVFPWLGVQTGAVSLGNAPGFGTQPFASTQAVNIRVQLLPLLRKKVEMDTITVDGLRLNLARDKHGKANWDDLLAAGSANRGGKKTGGSPIQLASLALGGVDIRDASLSWRDAARGEFYQLAGLNVHTGAVKANQPIELAISFDVETTKPSPMKGKVALQGKLGYDLDSQRYTVMPLRFKASMQGQAIPGGSADIDLKANVEADLKAQTATLSDLALNAMGAEVQGKLKVGKILGKAPVLNGHVRLQATDLDKLLGAAGQGALAQTLKALQGDIGIQGTARKLTLQPLTLQATVTGKGVPKPVNVSLASRADVDLDRQTLLLSGLSVSGLGMDIKGGISAAGILGRKPSFKGKLKVAPFNLRELMRSLGRKPPLTADPKVLGKVALDTSFSGSTSAIKITDLALQLDDTHLKGIVAVKDFNNPAIDFKLGVDAIDADRYLPPRARAGTAKKGPAPAPATPETAAGAAATLPLDTLRALKVKGEARIGRMKISNLKLKNIKLKIDARDGNIKLAPLSADLYRGRYKGSIGLDARGKVARLSLDEALTGIEIEPLLQDLTGKARLRGNGDFHARLTTQGATPEAMKAALNGRMGFVFRNGAVKGFNIGKMMRSLDSFKKTGSFKVAQQEETDFTEMTGNPVVKNGVITMNDLAAKSPAIRIRGKGMLANLPSNTINYLVEATVTDTSRGQGGKDLARLSGVTVPVKIHGSLDQPSISPDIGGLVLKRAQKAVTRKIEKQLGDKLKGKLGGQLKKLLKF